MPADLSFLADAIHLVAIVPDGPIWAQWFGSDRAAAEAHADQWNAAGAGVYWTVNVVAPGFDAKPTKRDIVAVRFAHADLDPPGAGGGWDRSAALADLIERGAPSLIIDSGNGLQPLWRLVDSPTVEEIERINRGAAAVFGGDHCHNVDRLLRVPGTINYPNAKKRSMGRVTVPTAILWADPAKRYESRTLAATWPAPAVERVDATDVELGAWVPLLVDDLQPAPTASIRNLATMTVAVGQRSEIASSLAVAMVAAGYTVEQVMGVLMCPGNAVSATILDKSNPEREAKRKIAFAVAAAPPRVDPAEVLSRPPGALPSGMQREEPVAVAAREGGYEPRGGGLMLHAQQMEHFRGCVYVSGIDKVLMPDGALLNQSRFDAVMGGHEFVVDNEGRKTSTSAWEAFLKNQRFSPPTAHALCFRPEHPPGAIIGSGSQRYVNIYVPIETPRKSGDAGPFLTHVRKLLPDERDQRILLTYMASVLQHPGHKAQWWPIIQGTKGNGKTLLLNIMSFGVGEQYSHLPNAAKMTRNGINFNGWIQGKLFLGLEEVYSATRRDFLEEFKPYITNHRLPIEGKGSEEVTGDNRANGIILTNHRDGVPIDRDERRYAPFFTAQQTRDDMDRDGMTGEYFVALWRWLRAEDGFAIINDFLLRYECEAEFDPYQLATRAPLTSSTDEAIVAGYGAAEQEILAAIEEERPGFAGGWISSKALENLFKTTGLKLPHNRRLSMLEPLGYVTHPALHDGRTPIAVPPDHVRCRLYVKRGSIQAQNLLTPAAVVEAYTKAQAHATEREVAGKLGGQ